MWNLKYGTNGPISKEKEMHRHREQICGCQDGGGRGCYGLVVWG